LLHVCLIAENLTVMTTYIAVVNWVLGTV